MKTRKLFKFWKSQRSIMTLEFENLEIISILKGGRFKMATLLLIYPSYHISHCLSQMLKSHQQSTQSRYEEIFFNFFLLKHFSIPICSLFLEDQEERPKTRQVRTTLVVEIFGSVKPCDMQFTVFCGKITKKFGYQYQELTQAI